MRLIKKTPEGERIDTTIIGWRIINYTDIKVLRITVYLKILVMRFEFGIPSGKDPSRL